VHTVGPQWGGEGGFAGCPGFCPFLPKAPPTPCSVWCSGNANSFKHSRPGEFTEACSRTQMNTDAGSRLSPASRPLDDPDQRTARCKPCVPGGTAVRRLRHIRAIPPPRYRNPVPAFEFAAAASNGSQGPEAAVHDDAIEELGRVVLGHCARRWLGLLRAHRGRSGLSGRCPEAAVHLGFTFSASSSPPSFEAPNLGLGSRPNSMTGGALSAGPSSGSLPGTCRRSSGWWYRLEKVAH